MNGTTRIKVGLSHGLPLIHAGLAATLSGQPDIEVAAECRPGEVAVAILDFEAGLSMAEELKRTPARDSRPCRVMVVTDQAGDWEIRRAVSVGVLGYHLVDSPLDRLVSGVRAVARGGRSFDEAVASRMADCLLLPELTQREHEVLMLIVEGACNKEVARRLGIAVGTVKAHVRALLDKLDVQSRLQATVVAKERGMLSGRRSWGAAAGPFTRTHATC